MTSGAQTLENSPSSDVAPSFSGVQQAIQQLKHLQKLQGLYSQEYDFQASVAPLQQMIERFYKERRQTALVNNQLLATLGVHPIESNSSYVSSVMSSPVFARAASEISIPIPFPTIMAPNETTNSLFPIATRVVITQLHSPGYFTHTPNIPPITVLFGGLFPVFVSGPAWIDTSSNDLKSDEFGLGPLGRISAIEEESTNLGLGCLAITEEDQIDDKMENQMDYEMEDQLDYEMES